MRPCLIRLAVVAIVAFSASANAEIIRYDFGGILTSAWSEEHDIAVGDHFTGYFLVNTEAGTDVFFPTPMGEDEEDGLYWGTYGGWPKDMALVVNGVDILAQNRKANGQLESTNWHTYYYVETRPTESRFMYGVNAWYGDNHQTGAFSLKIILGDSTEKLFDNNVDPPTNLHQVFSQFNIRSITFEPGMAFPARGFTGQIQYLIPEPATGALMLAMAAIGLTRRPRR